MNYIKTAADYIDDDIKATNDVFKSLNTSGSNGPKISGKLVDQVFFNKKTGRTERVYLKEVIYNNPATICFWSDNTKTVSKCAEVDSYNPESGLAICMLKKLVGSTEVHDLFNEWMPKQGNRVTLAQVRRSKRR